MLGLWRNECVLSLHIFCEWCVRVAGECDDRKNMNTRGAAVLADEKVGWFWRSQKNDLNPSTSKITCSKHKQTINTTNTTYNIYQALFAA
jgi:hypothetical protein